jgi:CRP-like cAMP-binding protein
MWRRRSPKRRHASSSCHGLRSSTCAGALGVIGVLARRVRAFAAVIENLALRNVTARLARLLLTEVRGDGNVVDLSGTREEIALRLGTARELVSRSLSELRAAGIVVVRGRRVWLTDERRLATIAELA